MRMPMIASRPGDAPDLRLALDEWANHPAFVGMMGFEEFEPDETRRDGVRRAGAIARNWLPTAQLLWVGPDVVGTVEELMSTVPADTSLGSAFPLGHGLLVFGRPLRLPPARISGKVVEQNVAACLWVSDGAWVEVVFYYSMPDGRVSPTPIGSAGGGPSETIGEQHADYHGDLAGVVATMSLIQYAKGLVSTSHDQPSRHAVKRSRRKGIDLGKTRVHYINNGGPGDGRGQREPGQRSHRWVVRGHWRLQPYGPGRTLRRAVWIHPHIKGPEGAPMLAGAKVDAFVRSPATPGVVGPSARTQVAPDGP